MPRPWVFSRLMLASVQADAAMFKYLMDMQERFKTFKRAVKAFLNS